MVFSPTSQEYLSEDSIVKTFIKIDLKDQVKEVLDLYNNGPENIIQTQEKEVIDLYNNIPENIIQTQEKEVIDLYNSIPENIIKTQEKEVLDLYKGGRRLISCTGVLVR
jgi:hypothetical protein